MNNLDNILSLSKQRGFFFISSEIYDGLCGVYDQGPLGVEFTQRIKSQWWKEMVYKNHNIVGLDSSILMNPRVWKATGHTEHFTDPYFECNGEKIRADHFLKEKTGIDSEGKNSKELEQLIKENVKEKDFPAGFSLKDLEIKTSNLLVKTDIGTSDGDVFLRGETCQGIYVNFKNVINSTRQKIPFGIAQVGKAFRNEISPRRFLFRTREFEQMEMQYFVKPENAKASFEEWKKKRMEWIVSLGIPREKLRFKKHTKPVFYAEEAEDIEFDFPSFGWSELEGIHNRRDYDLNCHQKESGENLEYADPATEEKYLPYIIETSIGVGRLAMAILISAYNEEKLENDETRIVLRLNKKITPVEVAVLPLSKNEKLTPIAKEVFDVLSEKFVCQYDETQSIGKRYRRQDEIGTPYCVTVDFDSLEDKSVTVRDRDTMKQERVSIESLVEYINNFQN